MNDNISIIDTRVVERQKFLFFGKTQFVCQVKERRTDYINTAGVGVEIVTTEKWRNATKAERDVLFH